MANSTLAIDPNQEYMYILPFTLPSTWYASYFTSNGYNKRKRYSRVSFFPIIKYPLLR